VPPSRVRYEAANPAVTVRISLELRDELAKLKEEHGLSLGDVLRIGLDKAKPQLDAAHQQWEKKGYQKTKRPSQTKPQIDAAHQRGEEKGYQKGKREYEVTYWCAGCRQRHLTITTAEEKEAAANMMFRAGWQIPDCR
jgi:hypothetical protein